MTKQAAAAAPAVQADPVADPAAARAQVDHYRDEELRIADVVFEQRAELAELEKSRGKAILNAADPAATGREIRERIVSLEHEIDGSLDAAGEASLVRTEAMAAVFVAEAAIKVQEAERDRTESAREEAETNRLLKALEAQAGCRFGPTPVVRLTGSATEQLLRWQNRGPIDFASGGVPKFELLRERAARLVLEAQQLRIRQPHAAGAVEADSVEDLFRGVVADAMTISPTLRAVVEWAELAKADELRRRARVDHGPALVAAGAPMRFQLAWSKGRIDLTHSRAYSSGLERDRLQAAGMEPRADPGGEVPSIAVGVQILEDVPLGDEVLSR